MSVVQRLRAVLGLDEIANARAGKKLDFSTLIILIAVLTGLTWGIRRMVREDKEESALGPAADDYYEEGLGPRLKSAQAIAAKIEQLRKDGDLEHPKELLSKNDFQKGVKLLLSRKLSPDEISECLYEHEQVFACMALEALAKRDDGKAARAQIFDSLCWLKAWPVYFALRCLDLLAPSTDSLIGRVVIEIAPQIDDPEIKDYLEGFVRTRLENGEELEFDDGTVSISEAQHSALKNFLDAIDEKLGKYFSETVEATQEQYVDHVLLQSIGTVWGEQQRAAAGDIVPHKALTEAVDELTTMILGPQRKSLLFAGEEGVGKTTAVTQLAARLYDQGWTIFQAGHAELIAGQSYLGQLEERVKELLRELVRGQRILWIIPDFQNLAFSGLHKYSPVSVLDTMLPHLEAGEITVACAVPTSSYEKLVTWNPSVATALSVRRMTAMPETEAKELALAWLKKHCGGKGGHSQTVSEAWDLAGQFLTNSCAPGNVLSFLELTRERLIAADPDKRPTIKANDLMLTLSQLTGLPTGLLDDKRHLDLDGLERTFNERVMGQPEAVQCLVERVAMIKAGLTDPSRPAGVFLFAGPTGTGKTEIAKTLTEWLFGNADRMIRLDMSEFQTADDLGRIVGEADASDSETLVGKIRKQPFSVILLDEFEKAHPRIWDIFLQVFDDGRLTGRSGQTTDFRHSIIILTSNLGAVIPTGVSLGFKDSGGGFDAGAVLQSVEKEFRKEFINRLDRVVVFRPLTRDLMRQILEKELKGVLSRRGLRSRPWAVEWDDAAIEFLLRKGFTPDLGARPLKRAIDRYLLSPLAVTIVKHKVPAGDQFLFVTRKGGGLDVQFVDPDAPEDEAVLGDPVADDEDEPASGQTSLTGIALQPRGSPQEIALLQSEYELLTGLVDGEGWSSAKADALTAMQAPGFWGSSQRFTTLDLIERRDRVESALTRAGSLLRRISGRKGDGRDAYPVRLVGLLGQNLYLLKLAMADIENGQPGDAMLRISVNPSASGDDDGAAQFARELAQMYRGWAKKRRMRFSVLEENHDAKKKDYSLVASVDGFGAYTILAREHGLHVLELQAKKAKGVSRYRVSVEVTPQGTPAGANGRNPGTLRKTNGSAKGTGGTSLKIVRRYRRTRSPLVRDAVSGWRTGRLDLVLGGDFDLMQGTA